MAGGRRGETAVRVGPVRRAGVRDQIGPGRVAVGRPLDAVAGDLRKAGVRRLVPGKVDLRAAVRAGGLRRRQTRRRARHAGDDGAVSSSLVKLAASLPAASCSALASSSPVGSV